MLHCRGIASEVKNCDIDLRHEFEWNSYKMCWTCLSTWIQGFSQLGWFITQINIVFWTLKMNFYLLSLLVRRTDMCCQVIYSSYGNEYPTLFYRERERERERECVCVCMWKPVSISNHFKFWKKIDRVSPYFIRDLRNFKLYRYIF